MLQDPLEALVQQQQDSWERVFYYFGVTSAVPTFRLVTFVLKMGIS